MTVDLIINTVCEALQLDKDKLLIDKVKRSKIHRDKYADAGYIATYLIRQRVLVPKETKKYGIDKRSPTYIEISRVFKRRHKAIIYWELECRINLRENKPDFKAKYDIVVNLLDNNVNVA